MPFFATYTCFKVKFHKPRQNDTLVQLHVPHVAMCRTVQQHVDVLTGRLVDSNLQVEQLKAEIVTLHSVHSEQQLDTGTSQSAKTDMAEHNMQQHRGDLAKDNDILRAQASNHTCSLYDHRQPQLHLDCISV